MCIPLIQVIIYSIARTICVCFNDDEPNILFRHVLCFTNEANLIDVVNSPHTILNLLFDVCLERNNRYMYIGHLQGLLGENKITIFPKHINV
jgi:hypothetical protein